MNKLIINISGMHCRSCEMLVEEKLAEIPEVSKFKVDYRKGQAEIYYGSQKPNGKEVEAAIRSAGYNLGLDSKESKALFSKNPSDWQDLGIAFLILAGVYLVVRSLGLTNINIGSPEGGYGSFWVVLLVGLTAGVSTCMALVGGLVLGLATRHAEQHPEATPLQKFRPHLLFNLGRISGFAFFGALLGQIGSFLQISTSTLGLITIAVGLVMLLMGLQLIQVFPFLDRIKITLPKFIGRKLGINKHGREYSHASAAMMGAMTFFLPCGFTQAMQLYAISTGSPLIGAVVMMTFAVGTAPGLLGIGGLTSVVRGIFAKRFFKLAGLLVLFFAFFNISNGFNLTGWQLNNVLASSQNIAINDPNVRLENGVQVVTMTQSANGYSPNSFTIKKDVKVKWVITSEEPYSCAASIVIPQLGIRQKLESGENIIEFTPIETGALKFSCSMGMYTGVFNVVDENGSGAAQTNSAGAVRPSGTCGVGGGGCGCGGGVKIQKDTSNTEAQVQGDTQVIKSTYTASNYLKPNTFKIKAGKSVKFTIDVKDNGRGCGNAIMIPGLYNQAVPLSAGQTIAMEFTPTTPGSYDITCGMGMIRFGTIVVE